MQLVQTEKIIVKQSDSPCFSKDKEQGARQQIHSSAPKEDTETSEGHCNNLLGLLSVDALDRYRSVRSTDTDSDVGWSNNLNCHTNLLSFEVQALACRLLCLERGAVQVVEHYLFVQIYL